MLIFKVSGEFILSFGNRTYHSATHSFLRKKMKEAIVFPRKRLRDGKHITVYYYLITAALISLEKRPYCIYCLVPVKAVHRDHKEELILMLLLVCYKFRNNFAPTVDL